MNRHQRGNRSASENFPEDGVVSAPLDGNSASESTTVSDPHPSPGARLDNTTNTTTSVEPQTEAAPAKREPRRGRRSGAVDVRGGGMGSAWLTLVIGAILLIILLVFVLQNLEEVQIAFLGWNFTMPVGVLILFAAIVGALVMALLAAMRILQLRHRATAASRRR